jgi:aspartate carbamoyltransferase catalytic subunit
MTLKDKSIVGIGDLSRAEIELIFRCADRFAAQPRGQTHLGRGFQLAALFFEPSTRTRLSFESAMNRLGGAVLTVADGQQSSASKGETLADTARIVSAYADLIVLRHPAEGAARVAADAARVPVINAGDGAHEHPTQTLTDLYTLGHELGHIEGLTVTLHGDLKYGRTVHSLAIGLAKFGGRVIFAPADPALAPPVPLVERLRAEFGVEPGWWDPDSGQPLPPTDALYLTRVQKERFGTATAGLRDYPRIDRETLRRWGLPERALLLHPLPRAGELDAELDSDHRSAYFRQAANGVPVRMATMALILGIAEEEWASGWGASRRPATLTGESAALASPRSTGFLSEGVACANPGCICNREPAMVQTRFTVAGFTGEGATRAVALRCRYCETPAAAPGALDRATNIYRRADDPRLAALVAGSAADALVFMPPRDGLVVEAARAARDANGSAPYHAPLGATA